MKNHNNTIIVLSISILVLCTVFLTVKPLITNSYSEKSIQLSDRIYHAGYLQKFVEHYTMRLNRLITKGTGAYKDIDPDDQNKFDFTVTVLLVAGLIALFVSVISLALFIMNRPKIPQPPISKSKLFFILLLIILNGSIIRLMLASACYGNTDMHSYHIVADIVEKGGNVYADTSKCNYSPVWFTILGFLKKLQLQIPQLQFYFIVKFYLCCVDLITLLFLLLIARIERLSLVKTAIFFYLNPVSFLLTGYHGQFENLAILMVVIGVFAYLKLRNRPIQGKAFLWVLATFGMVVKHNIFFELIICLHSSIRRYRVKLLLFAASVLLFFALFIPYWNSGSEGIIQNVFRYSSRVGSYGISSLFYSPALKYMFVVGLFLFPLFLKSDDIIEVCLLGMLFFMAFTTGIGVQYFVLPIAFAALRPSRGFMLYTLIASLFILGHKNNVCLPLLKSLTWNVVWAATLYWFIVGIQNNNKGRDVIAALKGKISTLVQTKTIGNNR